MEYRELAEESGIVNWRRCPALNTDATFIRDMADMVAEALEEPSLSVTEACISNNVGQIEDTVIDERMGFDNDDSKKKNNLGAAGTMLSELFNGNIVRMFGGL